MTFVPLWAIFFASPLALVAVAGGTAAVPIIIHLLNRKRYIVVHWAAMRFLLAAQKKNVRRLKLEQWFLLALRVLSLLLVVAAMTAVMPWVEPLWQRLFPGTTLGPSTQGRTHRILVLDGSFTMGTRRSDEQTRFDAAKAQARAILEQANAGDGFSLIYLSTPAQTIIAEPADDRAKVLRELDELTLAQGSADVAGGLHAVAELTSKPLGKYARREVYLLSDLRRSAWPLPLAPAGNDTPAGPAESWSRILPNARVLAFDVAGQDQENLAVTGLALNDPLPMVGVDLVLTVTLHNYSSHGRSNVPVDLLVGKAGSKVQLVPLGQKLLDINANASATVLFTFENQHRFREPGTYVLHVRAGEDRLDVDNTRSLAVTVRDRIPVMLVNGKPAPEPLDRASEFLKRALNPSPKGEPSPLTPAVVRVLFPREFQDAGLGDLFRPDAPVDVVALCDLPTVSGSEAARLETHLKRGGSVILGLGPNAAKNLDAYNRVLFNDGKGLLPGPLVGVRRAEPKQHFTLLATEESFKTPPLAGFRSDEERGILSTPYFDRYVQLDLPPNSPARRILSFLPSANAGPRLDPAVVEYAKHRGKVIIFTSSLNADWNEWPRTLSFPPFVQELLRSLVAGNTRQTLTVGEAVEEIVPAAFVGLSAQLRATKGDDLHTATVTTLDEAGVVRFTDVTQAGVYALRVGEAYDGVLAVNVPLQSATGGAESDLTRWSISDFKANVPEADVHRVTDVSDIPARTAVTVATNDAETPQYEARGPGVARWLLLVVLVAIVLETFLAWWYGSARAGQVGDPQRVQPTRWTTPLWFVPLLLLGCILAVVVHASLTGQFLGFLPYSVRLPIERMLGVPEAAPGEGTRWQLETMGYLTGDVYADRWFTGGLLVALAVLVFCIYRWERVGTVPHASRWRRPKPRLAALRFGVVALLLLVLLPQTKLAFEREGWPDVVLLIDESRSMGTVDTFRDPLVQTHAEELKQVWQTWSAPKVAALQEQIASTKATLAQSPAGPEATKQQALLATLEAKLQDYRTPHRLNLVKAMLAKQDGAWLAALLKQRQLRVHVYRAAGPSSQMAELNDPEQCAKLLADLADVTPTGESSELGTHVAGILKTFRGRSLHAIVYLTDGVTTKGEDLPRVAKNAARAGVPLYLVGVGDATETPDLFLSELRAEDVIHLNDRLILEAKVTSQGPGMPEFVPVVLSELKDGVSREIARETVRVVGGQPVKVKFVHQPKEAGEKTFVISIPTQPDEADVNNNRLEHRVYVAEAQRLRVLLAEGTPRYDYRYLKALLEREVDGGERGAKSITLDVFLASASPDAPKQDRTMLARFPSAEELRAYDVVVLGDLDVKLLPKGEAIAESLAKFVKDQGGGLLFAAGDQLAPHCFRDTPLADILPVTCDGPIPAPPNDTIKETYRPRLTTAGQSHPLFRFSTDDSESVAVWNQLTPMHWYAKGYRRKLSAEVLAVHPERAAEAVPGSTTREENHPLVLQQFVGAGRVLFLGFDETWRWRLRQDEPRFNQFWIQAIRVLAKSRIARIDLRTDRKTYRRDEPIRVTVRYPDGSPPPVGPVSVTLERKKTNAQGEVETQTVQLAQREGTHATYEGLLTRTPEGDYRFTLPNPPPQMGRPKAEAKVLPPPGELDRVQLAEGDMKRAAAEARGQYYRLHEAESLPADLPHGPRVALDQPCPPLVLWNHPALFLLLVTVLAAEWVMRKKWRLL